MQVINYYNAYFMKTRFRTFLGLVSLMLFFCYNVRSQVTIGSDYPPKSGALLDLKENDNIGANSIKGLLLPRVELTANNVLTIATGTGADLEHTGALVFNLKKIEIDAATRLCPGVHIWDGSKWQPLTPYPKIIVPPALAGPQSDLIDPRDSETYYTARFYSVKLNYSCTSPEPTIIDAGIWMTQNLRLTQGLVQNASDNLVTMQYANPSNTGASAALIRANGKLYNWAAATSQKGNTVNGQGNVDNPPSFVANNEQRGQPGADTEVKRQGICPTGWHLPTDTEFYTLAEALKLQPELYSSQTTASNADVGNVIKNTAGGTGSFQGTSKTSDQGGFDGLLTGFANSSSGISGYGVSTFWWSSSSFNLNNAYKRRVDNSTSSIDQNASARNNMFAIRCKKD